MRNKLIVLLLFLFSLQFSQMNITRIGQYNDGSSAYNDVWGYEKNGTSYIIIGKQRKYGVSIYEIQSNGTAVLRGDYEEDSSSSVWSEPRFYSRNGKDYVYLPIDASRNSDGASPILILDVTDLNNITKVNEFSTRSHNIFLYQDKLFTCGSQNGQRQHVECWDLTDPANPTLDWTYSDHYVHDLWVSDDKAYFAEIYNSSFAIYDVSNVTGSTLNDSHLIARHQYPNGFTHNITPTEDHNYVVTTDEHDQNDHLQLWDVRDPSNIINLWKHQEGSESIVHNAFILNDLIYASYYDRGTLIYDISDKDLIVKIGEFDTYTEGQDHSNGSFNGNWGVYPFIAGDFIASSDQTHCLFMLGFDKSSRAGIFELTVNDSNDANIVDNNLIVNVPEGVKYKKENGKVILKGPPGQSFDIIVYNEDHAPRVVSHRFEIGANVSNTVKLEANAFKDMEYYYVRSSDPNLTSLTQLYMYIPNSAGMEPEVVYNGSTITPSKITINNKSLYKANILFTAAGEQNVVLKLESLTKNINYTVDKTIKD